MTSQCHEGTGSHRIMVNCASHPMVGVCKIHDILFKAGLPPAQNLGVYHKEKVGACCLN